MPVPALLFPQIVIGEKHLIERKVARAFQLFMVADDFFQFLQPIQHGFQLAPDCGEQVIDMLHSIVVIAKLGADALLFQSKSGRAKMHLRCHLILITMPFPHGLVIIDPPINT